MAQTIAGRHCPAPFAAEWPPLSLRSLHSNNLLTFSSLCYSYCVCVYIYLYLYFLHLYDLEWGLFVFLLGRSLLHTRALHWVPISIPMPMPTHTHGFWVGIGAMLLFMCGHGCDIIVHGWALVLCIPASNSKSESNFSDAGNTLTKKCSGLKPTTVNGLLFVRSNQDMV
jgi:hypothetical protein